MKRLTCDDSALAGDRDIFGAAGTAAIFAGFWHRPGDFIGIDPTVRGGLSEIPLTAIGLSGVRATFFALRKALVHAVTVGLVRNDENAAVCPGRCRPGQKG